MLQRTMLRVQATPDVANIRTAEFRGQEHTVIPVIALVEGVLWPANAPSPELALAEEFGRFPEGWDGRPVVFDHPKDSEGVPVAANSPQVLEDNSFGQMFNTTLDDTKLKSEIWVNQELVDNLTEEGQSTVAALLEGELIEVSTGLFTMSEMSTGKFNGEKFEAIWRNIVPDHLAVLPEGVKGACSIEDGCGAPRSNNMHPVMRAMRMNTNAQPEDDDAITGNDDAAAQAGLLKRIMQMAGSIFSFKDNSEGINDSDLRTALDIAISSDEQDFVWVTAVFKGNNDTGTVVYQKGFEPNFLERGFALNDGVVSLDEEKTSVRPETQFVPIELQGTESDSTIQENAMHTKEQLVIELIANEASQFTEEDRPWLETLEDVQLAKLSPVDNEDADNSSGDDATGDSIDLHTVGDPVDDDVPPVSTEDYVAAAPEEVQEILNQGLSMHKARKDALITALSANARCRFTKEQLEAKSVDELENLASLACDISYEGAGANNSAGLRANQDDLPPEPAKLFNLNATADAA